MLKTNGHTAREADDIANLAFIGGRTNRQISDKPPGEYLPPLIAGSGIAAFDAQCIPTDPALLGIEGYKSFLAERRKIVSPRLNDFLGVSTQADAIPRVPFVPTTVALAKVD